MMRQRAIPQRRRIFLGCEGESEQSYGVMLAKLVETRHRRVHVDAVVLQPGGGDPLAIVERAVEMIRRRVARNGAYAIKAVLLDSDKIGLTPVRDARIERVALKHNLLLIWQRPCHEGLLLRHLEGCAALRPDSTERALIELSRRWTDYRKGLSALQLGARLTEASVLQAARDDAPLTEFLDAIEFAQD